MDEQDFRERVDARVDTPAREGLSGMTPVNLYRSINDSEAVTVAPDGRPMNLQPAWRQDFPIDWPVDHYVERRDFMKFLVLTSFALTVGQFWIAAENQWRRLRGRPEVRRIAALADVPIGGAVTFTYPGPADDCLLVRLDERTFVAYSQKCTHLACPVQPRVAEGLLHCPCHEGYFDLRSGRPIAGPPPRPLPRVQLEVRGDEIYATGIEERTT